MNVGTICFYNVQLHLLYGKRVFRESNLSWDNSADCVALLFERHELNKLFYGRKKGLVGRCAVMAVSWVICMERNKRTFKHFKGEGGTGFFCGKGFTFRQLYGHRFLRIQL